MVGPSQDLYLHNTDIHASIGIRIQEPSVRKAKAHAKDRASTEICLISHAIRYENINTGSNSDEGVRWGGYWTG
jgi:hypothetical protein